MSDGMTEAAYNWVYLHGRDPASISWPGADDIIEVQYTRDGFSTGRASTFNLSSEDIFAFRLVSERGYAQPAVVEEEYTGGSSNYYKVTVHNPTSGGEAYEAECNDIIEALGMNFAEGNVFKALWRSCAARTLGKRKRGQDEEGVYDAEKMVFFSNRTLKQRQQKGG